jgi:hypothetical protein
MLRQILNQIPMDVRRPIKHALAGIAVSLAVLVPGAFWYKFSMMSMIEASSVENISLLKSRMFTLRQQMVTESTIAGRNILNDNISVSNASLSRDVPFDLVVVLDSNRRLVEGFRSLTSNKQIVSLSSEAIKRLVPTDSSFFDQVTAKSPASGILKVEDRPMLVGVTASHKVGLNGKRGYFIFGRWLDPRRLAGTGEQAESRIDMYDLSNDERMPSDVKVSISPAQRSNGFHWSLNQNGGGHLYALIDDIGGRPAFVAKIPWSFTWRTNGKVGFRMFYIMAILAGVATWGTLFYGYRNDRRRVRRFDGLESLKDDHIRTLVEAFPGYAFAVKPSLQYVGVSRILAGVTGQEPSYFFDQMFGIVASEWNDGSLERTFRELSDPKRWPRVANINHVVEGLGERHVFHGTAHFLAKQNMMLVILTQKENSASLNVTELNAKNGRSEHLKAS